MPRPIRKYHEDYRLLAYDQDRETLAAAVSSNMIDAVCEEHDERFRSCDYIFLCAPVEFNVKYLEYFKDNIGPDTILTDVGSVKGIIHKEVERLGMESRFIGGHPMAGSEKTGFEASSDRLIENAYYIITPGGEVALERLTDFTEMISSLGAIPMVLTSEEHDFITAGVSHLPHIIASALVNLVNMLDSDQEYMKTIAAGGFRDITRIASSSPIMWEQICVENNQNISNVLDDYIRLLVQIKCFVDNKDSRSLYQMFASSRDYRDSIDVVDNGLLKKAYVLYLDIADEAGGIATIATILAMEKISIKNIGIIHNREFEEGVLKIEFYDGISMEKGAALLKKELYCLRTLNRSPFDIQFQKIFCQKQIAINSCREIQKYYKNRQESNMEIKNRQTSEENSLYPEINPFPIVQSCSVLLHRVLQRSHIFLRELTVSLLSPVSGKWESILKEMLPKSSFMERGFTDSVLRLKLWM